MSAKTGDVIYYHCAPEVDGILEFQHVAMKRGQIVGRVGVRTRELTETEDVPLECAEVRQLWVMGRFRKMGIGSRLLERCESDAEVDGCERICLAVRENDAELVQWYWKRGYRVYQVDGLEKGEVGMFKELKVEAGG